MATDRQAELGYRRSPTFKDRAMAPGVAFADWTSERIERKGGIHIEKVVPYRPGSFFERDFPCLVALLRQFRELPATIIIDGYVTLGQGGHAGVGAHLHRAVEPTFPVIGVEKAQVAGKVQPVPSKRRRDTARSIEYRSTNIKGDSLEHPHCLNVNADTRSL
jgi:deoxyinosine 3'endonuclease (endonuclease V)